MAKKDELEFEGGIDSPSKPNNSEKLKALQAAMDKIEKNFGKGSIMKMGDDHVEEVEVIPSGSIGLNAMVLNHQVRLLWQFMPLQKLRKPAV